MELMATPCITNARCIIPNDNQYRVLKDTEFPKVEILSLNEFARQFNNAK